jgi:hypothetical protein
MTTDAHRASASTVLRALRVSQQEGRAGRDRLWTIAKAGGATVRLHLQDGHMDTVSAADLSSLPEDGQSPVHARWRAIARRHGLHESTLMAFNHRPRRKKPAAPWTNPKLPSLGFGKQVYIPSADEVLFAQCVEEVGGNVATATLVYRSLAERPNLRLLRAARARATGRLGLGYSNPGLDGMFLSPNPQLAGASDAPGRWETVDGQREYQVRWAADFWKCSVYLQDVVYHAGWQAHVTPHQHYLVAGRLQDSPYFEAHPVAQAAPGDVWQRFGGTEAEDSHTGILASYVEVRPFPELHSDGRPLDVWTFRLLGGEKEGAGESIRDQIVIRGTDETTEGKHIRFYKPARTRATQFVGSVSHGQKCTIGTSHTMPWRSRA